MHSNRKIWLISSVLWFVFSGPGSKMPRIFSCHLNVYAIRIIAFSQLYINLPIRITVNVLGFCSVSVCVSLEIACKIDFQSKFTPLDLFSFNNSFSLYNDIIWNLLYPFGWQPIGKIFFSVFFDILLRYSFIFQAKYPVCVGYLHLFSFAKLVIFLGLLLMNIIFSFGA